MFLLTLLRIVVLLALILASILLSTLLRIVVLLASILLLIVDSMLVMVVPTLPFNSAIAFAFLSIAALLLPINVRFSIAIVPATLMSFSFWSTRLVRPFKSPLMPSTLTFTLLIAVVLFAIFVVFSLTLSSTAVIRVELSTMLSCK